jgi:hypothetical protein
MSYIKKHPGQFIVGLAALIILIAVLAGMGGRHERRYTLSQFGVMPLTSADCEAIKGKDNYPISLSFSAPHVGVLRDQVKATIAKYTGVITSDSFTYSSNPGSAPSGSGDSASLTVTFPADQQAAFLAELSTVVKKAGANDSGYSYQSPGSSSGGYSPYSTCTSMLQNISSDMTQLDIFTKALKRENDPQRISIISQSITTFHNNLQNDVNTMNDFWRTADKPSISISIYTMPTPVPTVMETR